MKVVSKSKDEEGRTILTVESGLFKKKTRYLAVDRITDMYFHWVKLPNKTVVRDTLSFQLDIWKREFIA